MRPDWRDGLVTGLPQPWDSTSTQFRAPALQSAVLKPLPGSWPERWGVDLPKLPVVVSAPQWLEEQALADGAFALALGFHLHLGAGAICDGKPCNIGCAV